MSDLARLDNELHRRAHMDRSLAAIRLCRSWLAVEYGEDDPTEVLGVLYAGLIYPYDYDLEVISR